MVGLEGLNPPGATPSVSGRACGVVPRRGDTSPMDVDNFDGVAVAARFPYHAHVVRS